MCVFAYYLPPSLVSFPTLSRGSSETSESSACSWQHKTSVCLQSVPKVNELHVQRINYKVKAFLMRTCLGTSDLDSEDQP